MQVKLLCWITDCFYLFKKKSLQFIISIKLKYVNSYIKTTTKSFILITWGKIVALIFFTDLPKANNLLCILEIYDFTWLLEKLIVSKALFDRKLIFIDYVISRIKLKSYNIHINIFQIKFTWNNYVE